MSSRDQYTTEYDPLTAGTEVSAAGAFSLEEILEEYGGSRKDRILQPAEKPLLAEAPAAVPAVPEQEEVPARRSRKVLAFPGVKAESAPEAPARPEPPAAPEKPVW